MFVPPLVLVVLLGTGRLFDVAATRYTNRAQAQAQAQALVVEDIRTALNHARKQGITAEWFSFPTAPLASQAADTGTNLRAPTDRGHCQECGEQRAQQNHLHEL